MAALVAEGRRNLRRVQVFRGPGLLALGGFWGVGVGGTEFAFLLSFKVNQILVV